MVLLLISGGTKVNYLAYICLILKGKFGEHLLPKRTTKNLLEVIIARKTPKNLIKKLKLLAN